MAGLPLTNDVNAEPSDEATWAWPDGRLHPDPPLPVARVSFLATGTLLPVPWFVDVEAPPCGEVMDVPARFTTDGQQRRFVCDRLEGHPADPFEDPDNTDHHRAVTDNIAGEVFIWPARPGTELLRPT